MASEDVELQRTLDYAVSVMEYKITDGALKGTLDRTVSLKFLEEYAGWAEEKQVE